MNPITKLFGAWPFKTHVCGPECQPHDVEERDLADDDDDGSTFFLGMVLGDIIEERDRQEELFPGATPASLALTDDRKLAILTEEFLEVARAVNDGEPIDDLYSELIQVAAVAGAWAESLQEAQRAFDLAQIANVAKAPLPKDSFFNHHNPDALGVFSQGTN